jgi:hypothetical protein
MGASALLLGTNFRVPEEGELMVPTVRIERTIKGRGRGFIRPLGADSDPPDPWGWVSLV